MEDAKKDDISVMEEAKKDDIEDDEDDDNNNGEETMNAVDDDLEDKLGEDDDDDENDDEETERDNGAIFRTGTPVSWAEAHIDNGYSGEDFLAVSPDGNYQAQPPSSNPLTHVDEDVGAATTATAATNAAAAKTTSSAASEVSEDACLFKNGV